MSFKQRPLLFVLATIPVFNTLLPQSVSHVSSLAFGTGPFVYRNPSSDFFSIGCMEETGKGLCRADRK